MSLKLTALSLVLASAVFAAAPPPATVTKEVTGEAAIVDGNRDKAFAEAKNAALREAVEQVAGVLVSSDTLTANSQLLSDRIFTRSAGYVRTHEVLERKEEGGVAKVKVRAEVGTAQLDKDLQAVQALIRRMSNSRLLIVLQEQAVSPDKVITSSAVLTQVLTDAFSKDGWRIIDPSFAAGKLELSSGVSLTTPDRKVIQELKVADYVITGTVTFRHEKPGSNSGTLQDQLKGFYMVSGEWELSVFATDSGTQVARLADKFDSSPESRGPAAPVVSYERTSFQIAQHRGKDIVASVRKAVVDYLSQAEQNGTQVVMTVQGLADFKAVKAFKDVLARTITGISDVKQGNFQKGQIQFDLRYLGSTEALAEALGEAAFQQKLTTALGGKPAAKASVTGVTSNTVELTLAR
ncbi:flagellar assembly protein T N-terminal domain-containing protein [Pyxidicoccus parkwayensis]|uniref:Flagellar assembly protein T N-terminal domain-containing protein n=1 Tax=Pyxidicoccus parkwayensis TaxID=2813578 RepID=A0ABX7P7E9_9BACT|nr:flagellar assembly protein T N-terminal domain-containing protein [Pyxidicoccus parkwaysis]QSQ26390.1 flagellar assembly protein T N-terminal domain-containing protein [Pyxidicoccus parkwaysis]